MINLDNVNDEARLLSSMQNTLRLEIAGLKALHDIIGVDAIKAIDCIVNLKGRLILTGMGKSGHVARKIAATFASTGTPAQYVHPAEASHGDLGMVTKDDAVLALSNSGETKELSDLVTYCRRFSVPLIAMTVNTQSNLARNADVVLQIPKAKEACAETLAPTTTTTQAMAYGDALAIALIENRGFTAKDFARFHPGGALGSALTHAKDLMHTRELSPLISEDVLMGQALIEMSSKGFGCIGVTDQDEKLVGIITDGDLRRNMTPDLLQQPAKAIMTKNPQHIRGDLIASEVLRIMTTSSQKITQIFVCDENTQPVGFIHIHDLLRVGVK